MRFEVCDVKKPLAAVWRIASRGNKVCFGPEDGDCYIEHIGSGRRMPMRRKGGSYVIDAVMEGGRKEEITVDSAAEESVCQEGFGGGKMEKVEKGRELKLVNASGGRIPHHGSKVIGFKAAVF